MGAVDEVRDRVDIVDVVGDYVQLKKSGRSYKGLCPFHDERTPSFVVFPDSGNWRCFGACAVGGDAFDFIMRVENVDFRGALELLARRVGVPLDPPSPVAAERHERRARMRECLTAAAEIYHDLLLRAPSGGPARDYLESRAFSVDAVRDFQLGWAPSGWSATGDALRSAGFGDDELLASGMSRPRDAGGVYDTFRGRLMFPIRDARGRVIGFGARTLDPEGVPKYLNSPQTELFDKSRVLYGLDGAGRAIREAERAVVVEGYTDVIRAHAAGFRNVVASLGTALTEAQLAALKRYASTIVLALDADAAGQAATLRGLDVAREAAEGDVVPVPTAKGLIEWPRRSDVELRVVALPEGQDPDDVVRADPERWRDLIADAAPVMSYLFDVLTADLDLEDAHDKTRAADRLLPVIAADPDPVARSAWVARLGDLIHVDAQTLAARMARPPDAGRRRRQEGAAAVEAPPSDLATWLLGHLLLAPERLDGLARRLRDDGQPPLGPNDFARPRERDLLAAVRHAAVGVPPPDAPPEQRLDALPDEMAAYADALRRRAATDPPLDEEERAAWLRTAVLRLRERDRKNRLEELRFVIADAEPGERSAFDARVLAVTEELLTLQRLLRP